MTDAAHPTAADSTQTAITLETPVARAAGDIVSVTLRRPNAGALRGTKMADLLQGDVDALIRILPRITEPTLTAPEIEAMDPSDFGELAGAVIGFFLKAEQRAALA